MAEIFRGSINAVPAVSPRPPQALGLDLSAQDCRYVVLPQAMRIAVPPAIGFLIALIKDSSLVTVIGYVELTHAGTTISNLTAEPITTYSVVAALYFVICYGVSRLAAGTRSAAAATASVRTRHRSTPALQLEGV